MQTLATSSMTYMYFVIKMATELAASCDVMFINSLSLTRGMVYSLIQLVPHAEVLISKIDVSSNTIYASIKKSIGKHIVSVELIF